MKLKRTFAAGVLAIVAAGAIAQAVAPAAKPAVQGAPAGLTIQAAPAHGPQGGPPGGPGARGPQGGPMSGAVGGPGAMQRDPDAVPAGWKDVTRAEAIKRATEQFEKMDLNHDGKVTFKEMREAQRQMRDKWMAENAERMKAAQAAQGGASGAKPAPAGKEAPKDAPAKK